MRYCQTINKECIVINPLDDINSVRYVELIKHGGSPIFSVWLDDGEGGWLWEFELFNPSDYERVKMSVFDAIFGCDTVIELADALDGIFEDEFGNILIVDECNNCDGCEGCNKNKN